MSTDDSLGKIPGGLGGPETPENQERLARAVKWLATVADDEVSIVSERLRMLAALPRSDSAAFDLADFIAESPVSIDDVDAFTLLLMISDESWTFAYKGEIAPKASERLSAWIGSFRPYVDRLMTLDDYGDDWTRLQVAFVTVRFPTFVDEQVHVKVVKLRGDTERFVMTPNSYIRFISVLLNDLTRANEDAIAEVDPGNWQDLAADLERIATYIKDKKLA